MDTETNQVVLTKRANLFMGPESVGGMLHVLEDRLYFKPHHLNFRTTPTEIRLDDVERAEKRRTLGFLPNGLRIFLKGGGHHDFVLSEREEVLAHLGGAVAV